MPGSTHDRRLKRERLTRLLSETGNDAVLLTSHEAVSWYLEGIRTHVSLAGPPVLAVRAALDGDELYVSANEADRLIAEELLPEDADRVVRVPWFEPVAAAAARPASAEIDLAAGLRAARASLLPAETERYRALCREVAEVLTDAARGARADSTEVEVSATLAGLLRARGIDPLVILVAGEARLPHRHPLPTATPLGARAMLVVCGRRHGLIANATRWIEDEGMRHPDEERILQVESGYLAATRPGTRLDEAFTAGTAAYAAAGFDADEWRRHHQGGPTGYAGRDPRATPETRDLVQENHAFAWNPSAPGVKVEDTVLVSSAGVEVLTHDPRWPTLVVDGLARPLPLMR
ncbi:M24 family metallopeptidase [Microbacterium sp. P5_E9]